jgi:hypothetical protein
MECGLMDMIEYSDLGFLFINGKCISIVINKKIIIESISIQFLASKTGTLRNEVFQRTLYWENSW